MLLWTLWRRDFLQAASVCSRLLLQMLLRVCGAAWTAPFLQPDLFS